MTILFVFMTIMIVNIYDMLVILICQILQKKRITLSKLDRNLENSPIKIKKIKKLV